MDYEKFKGSVLAMTGIDLSAYKENQMKRRINTLIDKHKISGYEEFVSSLKTDKALFEEALKVIRLSLETGVQTVAREEEEYTDEEDTEFREERKRSCIFDQFLREVVDYDSYCGKALYCLGCFKAQRFFLPFVSLGYSRTEQEKKGQSYEDYISRELKRSECLV